ncbi:MAG: hypothetical protein ABIJ16_03365, partial [Bacteroidota bacterium]
MERIISLLFIISFCLGCNAGIDQLSFFNNTERNVFRIIDEGGEFDYLTLLLVTDSNTDSLEIEKSRNIINESIDYLNSIGFRDQAPKKQIKILKKHIQGKYQKSFIRKATFTGGILKGYYNSYTGTAMYVYFLEFYNIPYVVAENRYYAYVVAYPENLAIKIISFPPEGEYVESDINGKLNYLNMLKINKVIPGEQSVYLSEEEYQKYYFPDNIDNIKQVAAMLYHSSGMDFMELPDVYNANTQFAKAFYLHKYIRNWYWYYNCLIVLLSKRSFTVNEDYYMLSELANLTVGPQGSPMCENLFGLMMNNLNEDQYQLEKGFRIIVNNTTHIPTKNAFAGMYYYERGRICHNHLDFSKALEFIDSCSNYMPYSKDFETLVLHSVIAYASRIESTGVVDFVQKYNTKFSFLFDIRSFKELMANAYLQEAYYYFFNKDLESGLKYLDYFEDFYKQYEELEPDKRIISSAYSEGCRVHFNKRKYTIAKS